VINSLLALPFAFKVATKDHHPPGHISFATSHGPDAQPFTSFTTVRNPANASETYETRLWPDHCVAGTPGNEFVRELDTAHIERVVLKGTDPRVEMYSAFRSPLRDPPLVSAVSELSDLLRERDVTDVYVVGLAGDYCVFHSANDSAEGGWKTYVIEEAVRSVGGEQGWEQAKKDMEQNGVRIIQADGDEVGWVRALAA